MMRQASSRTQRNKRIRVRYVLQICLLAAVCFWLLYQLKHSYDRKKALDEHDSRILNNVVDGQLEILDLGRKDLPHEKVMVSGDKGHMKEEENEEVEEEEDGVAQREIDDEEAEGVGDDGIDEQDTEQERAAEEAEDAEEFFNEENRDDQVEVSELMDDQEPKEGSSQVSHKERNKRDDASSSAHQENQVTGTEDRIHSVDEEQLMNNEKDVETENTTGRKDNDSKDYNSTSVSVVFTMGNGTIQNDSLIINGTALEKIEQELSPADNQTKLQANSTITIASDNQVKMLQTDSPIPITSNETEGKTNSVLIENGTLSGSSVRGQNTTVLLGSSEEDNSNLRRMVEEQLKKSNTTILQNSSEVLSAISISVNKNRDS
ncbi:hypothetical protein MUK42_29013 [Musa troglodytarum]|uniref:Uncharacterized protein n=2 Tax=Musa troglodytarum TaxID=320322 RepID=A0A9E7FLP8_9LILI|nr:hypothetical protein MUK42_29013 [Musa troglodytarum]URD97344.1 hypothetical protein MUK42_29013 [Musa troglodytarum]